MPVDRSFKGFLPAVGYSVAGSYICEGNDVSHTFRCPFGRTGISKLWPLCHRSGDGAEMPLIPKSLLLGNNPQSQIIREMVLGINWAPRNKAPTYYLEENKWPGVGTSGEDTTGLGALADEREYLLLGFSWGHDVLYRSKWWLNIAPYTEGSGRESRLVGSDFEKKRETDTVVIRTIIIEIPWRQRPERALGKTSHVWNLTNSGGHGLRVMYRFEISAVVY